MIYKKIKVNQYKNSLIFPIDEKLIKEEYLIVNINNVYIENILTIQDNMDLLAIGNYFHCLNITPEIIINNIQLSNNITNLNLNLLNLNEIQYNRNYFNFKNQKEEKNIIQLIHNEIILYPEIIFKIKQKFEEMSQLFKETAGVHSASIFDENGNNLGFFIDIARHNCISKATGFLIKNSEIIKNKNICLMLSCRINTEIIYMFERLGISTLITKAAPSYDSVIESEKKNITLIGFLKDDRFTIFSGTQRVIIK